MATYVWDREKVPSDVTVFLVPIPVEVTEGDEISKEGEGGNLKGSAITVDETAPVFSSILCTEGSEDHRTQPVAALHLHSKYLRSASEYFEARLSERWSSGSMLRPMEVTLELHTDVDVYMDVFSRMYPSHYMPVPFSSVKSCIEILKLSEKFIFKEAIMACVRYLSVVEVSTDEENGIRELLEFSAYLQSDCAADLRSRFRFIGTEEDRCKMVEEVSIRYIIDVLRAARDYKIEIDVMAMEYEEIMRGSCPRLAQHILEVTRKELNKSFETLRDVVRYNRRTMPGFWNNTDSSAVNAFTNEVLVIWCLFHLLLKVGQANDAVKTLALDGDLAEDIKSCAHNGSRLSDARVRLAAMFLKIFHGVQRGHILLSTSVRIDLMKSWRFLLCENCACTAYGKCNYCNWSQPYSPGTGVLDSLVMSLPLDQQVPFIKAGLEGPPEGMCNVLKARNTWFKKLLAQEINNPVPGSTPDLALEPAKEGQELAGTSCPSI